MARPKKSTFVLADRICERLADGESLRSIFPDDSILGKATVSRWLRNHEKFRDRYVRAREAQADALFDEILDIADQDCTMVRADKHGSRDDDGETQRLFSTMSRCSATGCGLTLASGWLES